MDITVKSKEADKDTVICRNQAETGTFFKRRICMTKREWKFTEDQARQFGARLQNGAGSALAN